MTLKKSEICLAHTLRRADRKVSQIYNEHMAPLGIRGTQFSVLRAIHKFSTTTASQIQETLTMEQTTVSRALKPLVRDGYIRIGEGATKREKSLTLTSAGETLYQQGLGPWGKAQRKMREILGQGQDDILIALSNKIVGRSM